MDHAIQGVPETSPVTQEVKSPTDSTRQIVQMLNTIQYLLTAGSYQGKDASLVFSATQFCIDFKRHLEGENKKKEIVENPA